MTEKVNHPSHYNFGKPEVIDIADHWGLAADADAFNVLKYFLRAPHKGNEEEDYRKAMWYLERIYARKNISEVASWCAFKRSQIRVKVSKLNLDWFIPTGKIRDSEFTVQKVTDGWKLKGNRRFFIQHFHYSNFHCEACMKSLSDLIDEISDGEGEEGDL